MALKAALATLWLAGGLVSALMCAAAPGAAQGIERIDCADRPACVLDTLWPQTDGLKAHERRGLARAFVEAAAASGVAGLAEDWSARTGEVAGVADAGFGEARAAAALANMTPAQVREAAALRAPPWFNVARVDVMLGVWRITQDDALRQGIVADLRALAAAGEGEDAQDALRTDLWEARDAAHSLAVIGLAGCDPALVEAGAAGSGFPDHLRYRIWLAHARGTPADPAAIREAAGDEVDLLRAAVEAYGEAWRAGACS